MLFGSRTTDAMGANFIINETCCIDYDFMLVGHGTSQDAAELVYLMTSLLLDMSKTTSFRQVVCGNLMEIRFYGRTGKLATRKVQINLVPRPGILDATDAIDIGPTAIFFDGTTVFATPFTMQQFTARTISLKDDVHCSSSERILKYMRRGFLVHLPNLDVAKIAGCSAYCTFATINFQINAQGGEYFVVVPERSRRSTIKNEDYDIAMCADTIWNAPQHILNTQRLFGENTVVLVGEEGCMLPKLEPPFVMEDFLSESMMRQSLYAVAKIAFGTHGVNLKSLRVDFGMVPAEIHDFIDMALLDDHAALAFLRKRLEIQYHKIKDLVLDPFLPLIARPTKDSFYGTYYKKATTATKINPTSLTFLARYIANMDTQQCGMCQHSISPGPNVITLACDHMFHYSVSEACSGVKDWIVPHETCPVCRAAVT